MAQNPKKSKGRKLGDCNESNQQSTLLRSNEPVMRRKEKIDFEIGHLEERK
jgi:hypothetical protein